MTELDPTAPLAAAAAAESPVAAAQASSAAVAPESPAAAATASPAAATPESLAVAAPASTAASSPAAEPDPAELENGIVEALKTVYDPEIPVNIYELGLIYDLSIEPGGKAVVKMTLTSPACPVAGSLPGEVKSKVESVPGVAEADVEVVWDPVWNPSMMSEAARLQLGMF
jgi:FeS assembly SUF system protein